MHKVFGTNNPTLNLRAGLQHGMSFGES